MPCMCIFYDLPSHVAAILSYYVSSSAPPPYYVSGPTSLPFIAVRASSTTFGFAHSFGIYEAAILSYYVSGFTTTLLQGVRLKVRYWFPINFNLVSFRKTAIIGEKTIFSEKMLISIEKHGISIWVVLSVCLWPNPTTFYFHHPECR